MGRSVPHPLKEGQLKMAPHPALSDVGHEAPSSAPNGATPKLLGRFAGLVSCPLAQCPVLLVRMRRGGDFSL